jgi:hypothetical protein
MKCDLNHNLLMSLKKVVIKGMIIKGVYYIIISLNFMH